MSTCRLPRNNPNISGQKTPNHPYVAHFTICDKGHDRYCHLWQNKRDAYADALTHNHYAHQEIRAQGVDFAQVVPGFVNIPF